MASLETFDYKFISKFSSTKVYPENKSSDFVIFVCSLFLCLDNVELFIFQSCVLYLNVC